MATPHEQTRRAIEARLAKPRHVTIRQPLLERVADFFGSDRGISFMLGFLSGALFCCGSLILLAKVFS